MDFLMNDLSFHGQFHDKSAFQKAIGKLMQMKSISQQHGRQFYCHRNILQALVSPTCKIQQFVNQALSREERNAFLQWITKHGPFWEDVRQHSSNDLFQCNEEIVTDTAVGEAAWCLLHNIARGLISLDPSCWCSTPILVSHVINGATPQIPTAVENYWNSTKLKETLESTSLPVASWNDLELVSQKRLMNLHFAKDAFRPLYAQPFVRSASERIQFILKKLDRFAVCFDELGQRTAEGHEIYKNFFTGKKEQGGHGPIFSDSSNTEKNDYINALTFQHPTNPGQTIFCPWHGKIQTPQLRVHFSWPIRAGEILYIVYIGPKITRQ